jgi:hypothetical protein
MTCYPVSLLNKKIACFIADPLLQAHTLNSRTQERAREHTQRSNQANNLLDAGHVQIARKAVYIVCNMIHLL